MRGDERFGIRISRCNRREDLMKTFRTAFIFCILLAVLQRLYGGGTGHACRIMTFNIRVDVASDSLNAWPHRKDIAAGMIRFHHADIACLQEALSGQVADLKERLPDYGWFGVGRDDGKKEGEFMAVFYLRERFTVVRQSTFWLSENPESPGRGWDAACNRVVTWGEFRDHESGGTFFLFNTHFDHMGQIAREESARLLKKKIGGIAGNRDFVVTGDFNSTPDSDIYRILTRDSTKGAGINLTDSKTVSLNPHHGPGGTFTGFQFPSLLEKGQPIDYIFVSNKIKVINHGVLSDTFDGFFPSDHMPVLAEIVID
jgi:endonuclease/exonuclease/phosphatase family metal-dependent hydrolase